MFLKNDIKNAQRSLLKSAKIHDSDWLTFFYLGKVYISIEDETRGLKCLRRSCALKRTLDNVGLICQYLSPEETLNLLARLKMSSKITLMSFIVTKTVIMVLEEVNKIKNQIISAWEESP